MRNGCPEGQLRENSIFTLTSVPGGRVEKTEFDCCTNIYIRICENLLIGCNPRSIGKILYGSGRGNKECKYPILRLYYTRARRPLSGEAVRPVSK